MNVEYVYSLRPVQSLLQRRRRARARFLLSKVLTFPGMSILDVGCGTDGNSLEAVLPPESTVVGIDLIDPNRVRITHPKFEYIQQDAADLRRFRDKQFDLAVSVGMMEHICDRQKLTAIANEMIRVAKQLAVVVPWRYAWIEPHFKFPFFQLLPRLAQVAITRTLNCDGHGQLARLNPRAFESRLRQSYQWLSTAEWKAIFKAQKGYLAPTLETLVIVRRSQ
jgi:ubiquinone/menaquinone biosynthesis C-methylase UbiE